MNIIMRKCSWNFSEFHTNATPDRCQAPSRCHAFRMVIFNVWVRNRSISFLWFLTLPKDLDSEERFGETAKLRQWNDRLESSHVYRWYISNGTAAVLQVFPGQLKTLINVLFFVLHHVEMGLIPLLMLTVHRRKCQKHCASYPSVLNWKWFK